MNPPRLNPPAMLFVGVMLILAAGVFQIIANMFLGQQSSALMASIPIGVVALLGWLSTTCHFLGVALIAGSIVARYLREDRRSGTAASR